MKPDQPRRRRPVYNEALGRAIKVLRTEQGLERRDLADQAGISYSYLAEIENGNKPPSSQVLLALSEVLGVRPSQLHAAADALPDRFESLNTPSARQSEIAASLSQRVDASRRPYQEKALFVSSVDRADRRAIVGEIARLLDRVDDDDLAMVLDLARRLAR